MQLSASRLETPLLIRLRSNLICVGVLHVISGQVFPYSCFLQFIRVL